MITPKLHPFPAFIVIISMTFLLTSCATNKDMLDLSNNIAIRNKVVNERLDRMEQSLASIQNMLQEQQNLTKDLRALVGTRDAEQRDMIASIMARQDDINYQLHELLDKLQAIQLYGGISAQTSPETPDQLTPQPVDRKPAAAQPENQSQPIALPDDTAETDDSNAEEVFNAAVADIDQGNYMLAESRFLTFLIQFPKHERAADAQFYLGKVAFDQKKFDLAVTEIDKLLKQFPKSPRIPAAMLMKGIAQIESGNTQDAAATLKQLLSTYPKSDEAKQAREKLESL